MATIEYSKCDDCSTRDLERIEHPINQTDYRGYSGSQGYLVYRCRVCKDYWGLRWQFHPGTGSDDHWHRFGPNIENVSRHY
jgi:hypothetical protein